jgi:hypothetical protein
MSWPKLSWGRIGRALQAAAVPVTVGVWQIYPPRGRFAAYLAHSGVVLLWFVAALATRFAGTALKHASEDPTRRRRLAVVAGSAAAASIVLWVLNLPPAHESTLTAALDVRQGAAAKVAGAKEYAAAPRPSKASGAVHLLSNDERRERITRALHDGRVQEAAEYLDSMVDYAARAEECERVFNATIREAANQDTTRRDAAFGTAEALADACWDGSARDEWLKRIEDERFKQ